MARIQPLGPATIARARTKLLGRLEDEGRLHLHLLTYRAPCVGWHVAWNETALCGTDRCIWLKKRA